MTGQDKVLIGTSLLESYVTTRVLTGDRMLSRSVMVDLTREVTANLTPHFRVSVHPSEVETSRFTLEETAP